MNDTTFKLRVPTKDLDLWKLAASKTKMSLAEWVRNLCDSEVQMCGLERCNGETKEAQGTCEHEATAESYPAKREKKAERTCPHGEKVGWRCTLCGGIVK